MISRRGGIGASPAATAFWMPADADEYHPGSQYLMEIVGRTGGPVPCAVPVTQFERAWVVQVLARTRSATRLPADLVESLIAALGKDGAAGGVGLPPDADTTAVTLYSLALAGRVIEPDCLAGYETATHFCTWPGEQGESTSVNAHVLEAYGSYVAKRPESRRRYRSAITKVIQWLLDRQRDDGSWSDRWHASPYYATATAVVALDRFGGRVASPAISRAIEWVLRTRRPTGGWGIWSQTNEETAYALQMLLDTAEGRRQGTEVVANGYRVLRSAVHGGDPPMWHDKDLYRPDAIIRANVLAAVHLGRQAGLEWSHHNNNPIMIPRQRVPDHDDS
jgi:hypothetical protein